jgi:hypothetical protein
MEATSPDPRSRKFRQAAFVYLLVGILYSGAVWAMAGAGILPAERGPVQLWIVFGVVIVAFVFWALWSWQNAWVARIVFVLHAFRVPPLIENGYFPDPDAAIPPSFYITALLVVVINLWMLARAGWDL